MQGKLLDILACPIDGFFPLRSISLVTEEEDILEGVLLCEKCGRWFPVRNGIPHLIRDGLRFVEEDRAFLQKFASRLPENLVSEAPPLNLSDDPPKKSPEDEKIMEEGQYWSGYARAHYNVGDTSFLDVRSKSTHPSFYPLGVLERDDKDRDRKYGMWPDHLSSVIFGFLESLSPGVALDAGCGAGQFALEPAYLGWDVIALDVALGALEVGRDYALSRGQAVHYIYAEPEFPPLRQETVDLLLAKDSLHHLPRVERVFENLHRVLKYRGKFLFFDHVSQSKTCRAIINHVNRRLHPKISARYPKVEVPEALKKESPAEDIGMKDIMRLVPEYFHVEQSVREHMLYHILEFSVYYAFGKRRRFTRAVTFLVKWLIEKPLLLFEDAEFALLIGRKKVRSGGNH